VTANDPFKPNEFPVIAAQIGDAPELRTRLPLEVQGSRPDSAIEAGAGVKEAHT